MKIKCLLVDDEPLAIKLIQKHIEQLDSFEVTATCSNAVKALETPAVHAYRSFISRH